MEHNLLPVDPGWIKAVEGMCTSAAHELKCMVLVVAIQDGGRLAVTVEGEPAQGHLHDLAQDVPLLLLTLAKTLAMVNLIEMEQRH